MLRHALKLAIAALGLLTSAAHADTLVIHAGHVLTDAAATPSGPATITVVDGRITAITAGLQLAPEGATLIDQSARTIVPGLIDLHVHLSSNPSGDFWREAVDPDEWGVVVGTANALITVRAGFTTVREAGSARNVGFVLRRGTEEGVIPGPRIIAAGPPLSIIGGHGDVTGFRREVLDALATGFTCTGAVQCAERVREASRAGSDVIKITATGGVLSQQGRGLEAHFSAEEMASIATTAHSLGLRVMAHAHGARGIEAAARAGIDSIEHGTFADEAALRVMAERGTYMVPTLMAFTGIRERLGRGIYTPVVEQKVRETLAHVGEAVRLSQRLGVTIAFGTDAGVFEHGRNAEEFALLTQYGLTNAQALATATTTAARVLGMENELGRIAVGYSADLIAVDADPLTDIRTLEHVRWVMARGRVIP